MTDVNGTGGRLTDREHWESRWSAAPISGLEFSPRMRNFRDLHRLFQRILPGEGEKVRFLELGCYPGRYLWYFHRYFGYRVSGIDYIGWCCEKTRELLASYGVEAGIIHADIFDYRPAPDAPLWDVVASFGLIEHFLDSRLMIGRHLDLLIPGGFLVLIVPNFQGLYGRILKWASPELYAAHRIMSREDLVREASAAGALEIVEAGYYGRLGLGHTGLREKLGGRSTGRMFLARALAFALEITGQALPRSTWLSPNIALIARKK